MQEIAQASRLALLIALAAAPSAHAVAFGSAETRSALGEPLDARIPFTLQQGDEVDASCFALVRDRGDGPQMLGEGVLTIERSRGGGVLRIRTIAPVVEPAVMLRVRTSCAGQNGHIVREYPLLLDPRFEATPSSISSPAIAARLTASEGETLEGLAAKVHPGNAEARNRYVAALRDLNPELAARGDREPIPAGTPIALADLRGPLPRAAAARPRVAAPPPESQAAIAQAPAAEAAAPPQARPAAPAAPPPVRAERAERKATPRLRLAEKSGSPTAAPAPAVRRADRPVRVPSGFTLKLSSQEIDLSRSTQVDDRIRAQLRERLLVLDADDQVAAMLAMRNSLRQLESRVADMQLKLDSLGPVPVRPQAAKAEPPRIEPPTVEAKPAPVEAPKPVTPEPAVVATEAAKAEPPKTETEPPKVESAPPAPQPAPRPAARTAAPVESGLPSWLWTVVGVLLGLVVLIALWLRRRNRDAHAPGEWADQEEEALPDDQVESHPDKTETMQARRAAEEDDELNVRMDSARADRTQRVAPAPAAASDAFEIAAEVRPELDSDASLATRLKEDSSGLRKRYLEERFPEVQNRTIVLEDPTSVVKGARLFYEDGALTRAVELLQFAIEDNPAEVRPWLALFEIFRLEGLTGQFAELAQRFRERHGKSEYWRKVQFFGREIEPGNALYREEPANTLETIGPREAKRLAAGLAGASASAAVDPITENWLNAPMDFENEVLANELRMSLMAGASLTEQDLVPNPMPALRGVEMFNVG